MSRIFETTLRVRYAETDQMAVVYYANYINWFEVGRTEMLRQLGLTYRQMEEDGMVLPVVEVKCRYKHPARYDDEITIRTWVVHLRASFLRFQYEVARKSDGRLLAEGESVHVVVGRDMKRTHLTEKYRDVLLAVVGAAETATES
jgi:acyl-CoA thioester hydrolase